MTVPTAVITGAANGIGAGLARAAGRRGLRVVLADVARDGGQGVAAELRGSGVDATAVPTDVTDPDALVRLADVAYDRDGEVVLLANNAGIEAGGLMWDRPASWRRTLDVNLHGAHHGVSAFVPRMLARNSTATVLIVASLGAFLTVAHQSAYQVSKAAAVALSECLTADLASVGAPITVLTVFPGAVATSIFDAADEPLDAASRAVLKAFGAAVTEHGMAPDAAAELIMAAAGRHATCVTTDPDMAAHLIGQRRAALDTLARGLAATT